MTSNSVL